MKHLSFILWLLIATSSLYAQRTRFSVQVDLGVSTISGLDNTVPQIGLPNSPGLEVFDGFSTSPTLYAAAGAGFQHEYKNLFFIQSSLNLLIFKGVRFEDVYDAKEKVPGIRIAGLEYETFFGKKIRLKRYGYDYSNRYILLGVGPTIAYNAGFYRNTSGGGWYEEGWHYDPQEDDYYPDEEYHSDPDLSARLKPFNFSIRGFVGYEFGNNQILLTYGRDITYLFEDSRFNSRSSILKFSYVHFF